MRTEDVFDEIKGCYDYRKCPICFNCRNYNSSYRKCLKCVAFPNNICKHTEKEILNAFKFLYKNKRTNVEL